MQKSYPMDYNLLMDEDLWQAGCQIFLIILLKEFIDLNVNIGVIIKNVKYVELSTRIVSLS